MRFLFYIILCCLIVPFSSVNSYSSECKAFFYDDESLQTPKTNIPIHATVFLKIKCKDVPSGENIINVNWINPKNKVYAYDKNSFTVDSPSPWVFVFSFKLMGKGPLERNFTHTDFNNENFGIWKVDAYLGGERVLSEQFNLY